MSGSEPPLIVRDPRILGGRPVFAGTRVQVEVLFENLADGYSLDDIVTSFPSLERDMLQRVLHKACSQLIVDLPEIDQTTGQSDLAHYA